MNATVGKLTTQQTNTYHWQELTTEAYNYRKTGRQYTQNCIQ